ncbi:hypothetical protein AXA44_37085 [Rhodococcus sp. SC4]|nr:hypothetical protein AXA44_37085 [Rhodococcus sp. SC4]
MTVQARRLEDKVILVTGASSGIGEAAARRFAAEGAAVVVGARRVNRLNDLVAELSEAGSDALAVPLDVTDEESVQRAIAQAVDRFGRLNGAFNSAGIFGTGQFLTDSDSASYREVLDVNLTGTYYSMKHEIPAIVAAGGGSIVNNSSVGGLIGLPGLSDYVAAKWGVIGMTKSAALEYAPANVRINAIAPGTTRTEMSAGQLSTAEGVAAAASMSPMNHIALPDDIARVALFLLSEESRWTTGTTIAADGGHHV